ASLVASPSSLSFSQNANTTTATTQQLSITNPSGSNVTWTASANASWLSFSPTTGGTPGTLNVSVVAGSLSPGTYSGTVTVSSTNPVLSVSVPVTFEVLTPPTVISTS